MHMRQMFAAHPDDRGNTSDTLIREMLLVCEAACRDAAATIH